MENIYDIRKKEKLLFIIGESCDANAINIQNVLDKCVFVINLYYHETLDECCQYINRIPDEIMVLCVSSKQTVIDDAIKKIYHKKTKYILKNNRGRDVSALLVTTRDIVKRYRYVCWLHDKKCKFNDEEEEVRKWYIGLWNNCAKSSNYIKNVVKIFEKNKKIGMLLPPEPAGDYSYAWYGDAWTNEKNYIICKKLAEKYHLNVNIERETPPLLATVMWARTDSLSKLLNIRWEYEDFPEEPMPIDGTISHALERCYSYFAQDAGYSVGTIMCESYATEMLLWAQENMRFMFDILEKEFYVNTIHQLKKLKTQEALLRDVFSKYNNILIYGIGKYSENLLKKIEKLGYTVFGFVVSDGRRKFKFYRDYPVFELNEVVSDDFFFIIATSYSIQDEIADTLKARGIHKYIKGIV